MLKFYVRLFLLSTLSLSSQTSLAQALLYINEVDLIGLIEKQSPDYLEARSKTLTGQLSYQQNLKSYKWVLGLDASREQDRTESLSTLTPLSIDKENYSFFLDKKFLTGTSTSLELSQVNYDSKSSGLAYTQNYYSVTIEQNLFPLLASPQDKLTLAALEADAERITLQQSAEQLEIKKTILDLFWKTLAKQISVKENNDLLRKYDSLVKTIRRKKQNSYASAGELEQGLAEYETRKQVWAEDNNTLKIYLQKLKAALNIPAEQQIELRVASKKPSKPLIYKKSVKSLQQYRIQQLKMSAARLNADSTRFKDAPKISLYGKYTGQGLDSDKSQAQEELLDDSKDKYSIGIKLDYTINDTYSNTERAYKLNQLQIEEMRFNRLEQDLNLQLENAWSNLQSAYNNIDVTQNVVKYRTEAVKQITTNYNQGRTDISFLIDAFNKKIVAEVAAIAAIGNYNLALIDYNILTLEN